MQAYGRVIAAFSTALLVASVLTRPALSFKLSPAGTIIERNIARKSSAGLVERSLIELARRGVTQFTAPVHEEIT